MFAANQLQGMLPLEEIKRRVSQFTSTGLPLVVTQASRGSGLCCSWGLRRQLRRCDCVFRALRDTGVPPFVLRLPTPTHLATPEPAPCCQCTAQSRNFRQPPAGAAVHSESGPLPRLNLRGWVRSNASDVSGCLACLLHVPCCRPGVVLNPAEPAELPLWRSSDRLPQHGVRPCTGRICPAARSPCTYLTPALPAAAA